MGKEYIGITRRTFIIDPEGKLAKIYPKVKPEPHAQQVLDDLKELMADIDTVQKSLEHRPFDPDSDAHKRFLEKTDEKILKLRQQLPEIEFHKKRK